MFCPKCGKQLPENSTFCSGCGAQLAAKPAAPAVAARPAHVAAPKTPKASAVGGAGSLSVPNILGIVGYVLAIVAAFLPWARLEQAGALNDLSGFAAMFGYQSGPAFQESYNLVDIINLGNAVGESMLVIAAIILVLTIAAIALGAFSIFKTVTGQGGIIPRISAIVFVALAIVAFVLIMLIEDLDAQFLPMLLMIVGGAMALILPQKAA